jgi:hypothetical protein
MAVVTIAAVAVMTAVTTAVSKADACTPIRPGIYGPRVNDRTLINHGSSNNDRALNVNGALYIHRPRRHIGRLDVCRATA